MAGRERQATLAKAGIRTASPASSMCRLLPWQRRRAASSAGKPGAVLAQSPSAGSRIDQTTIVQFTVVK